MSSRDRTVRVWEVSPADKRKYEVAKVLLGHTIFVGPLAYISPNKKFPEGGIVSGGMDTMLILWDLKSGERAETLKGHQMQVTGIALDNGDIVSCSIDCSLRRWRNGKNVEVWDAHKAPVQAVIRLQCWSQDRTCTRNTFRAHRYKDEKGVKLSFAYAVMLCLEQLGDNPSHELAIPSYYKGHHDAIDDRGRSLRWRRRLSQLIC